jgi:hypothetical protein
MEDERGGGMNAYELIEELEERYLQGCIYQDAANMLRQQADRIAELEKQVVIWEKATMDARIKGAVENQNKPVAWFMKANDPDLTCPNYLTMDKPTRQQKVSHNAIPLYTTPQTKPLSDEEIDEIIIKFWQGRFGRRVWDKGLLKDLCRAIEAKVRGEK